MTKETTQQLRMRLLEESNKSLENKVDKIMTNHLPHIQLDVMSVKTRVNVMGAINLGAIILGLIIGALLG